ncbi:hypothetical protein Tco_0651932 [Tanacetum coccineum]|uniref:Uncharacterized protein n=1 Tax=Tanacetum coccineum TaxID=301880 RepID=A0ABQ4WW55_9ASTR
MPVSQAENPLFPIRIRITDIGQAGLDLGKTPESQPPPEHDLMEEDQAGSDPGLSHVARVGLNPEPMHDDFIAIVYLSVNENLKHATEEQVHMEIPLSSSRTLSSMKNLDNFNFGDQFVNDNPTEEDSGKTNMETEVESMVTVSIRQASILVPHILHTIGDLSPHKTLIRKKIIHQRMFKNDTYKSLPEHVALYETLEASMERANMEKFLAEKDKSQDTGNAHLPKIRTPATWLRPLPEEDRPETPEPNWSVPPNDLLKPENNWANALATTYKIPGKTSYFKRQVIWARSSNVKPFHTNSISLQFQMEECHRLLTETDYSEKDDKKQSQNDMMGHGMEKCEKCIRRQTIDRYALSISKLKATRYLDFELEELVPSLWIESEREYDISAAYGITYWWFKRKELYFKKHSAPQIVDNQDSHADSSCCPYQYIIWDALDFLIKEDYTIMSKPRAVIYMDRNDAKKMLRENEVHKFSDGTLTRVMDKLDHMVKDFRLYKYNKGMEGRIWSEDDKRRSDEFMKNTRHLNSKWRREAAEIDDMRVISLETVEKEEVRGKSPLSCSREGFGFIASLGLWTDRSCKKLTTALVFCSLCKLTPIST